ncbi:exo-alpha-sialidase, partial [Klebsiella aerogenes]|uniref:exo-alpha-sialidase n=1 Tax=Klebsiella aerogenes TaxID=548 RepID=UPI0019548A13
RSLSGDQGRTWSPPRPTSLPNNNSSIQAIRLQDGRLAMVHNHASKADATDRRISLYDDIEDEGGPAVAAIDDPALGRKTAFWGAPRAPMSLA